jgi:hypothetical protein
MTQSDAFGRGGRPCTAWGFNQAHLVENSLLVGEQTSHCIGRQTSAVLGVNEGSGLRTAFFMPWSGSRWRQASAVRPGKRH